MPTGKAVQGHVENPAVAAAEPGGQPAQLVMMLGQEHGVTGAGQYIGGRHPPQPAADHDDVVVVTEVLRRERWACRGGWEAGKQLSPQFGDGYSY